MTCTLLELARQHADHWQRLPDTRTAVAPLGLTSTLDRLQSHSFSGQIPQNPFKMVMKIHVHQRPSGFSDGKPVDFDMSIESHESIAGLKVRALRGAGA